MRGVGRGRLAVAVLLKEGEGHSLQGLRHVRIQRERAAEGRLCFGVLSRLGEEKAAVQVRLGKIRISTARSLEGGEGVVGSASAGQPDAAVHVDRTGRSRGRFRAAKSNSRQHH